MKTRFVSLLTVALASAFPRAPIFAQGPPPPAQPYIQVPIPVITGFGPQPRQEPSYDRERWEHCEQAEGQRTRHSRATGLRATLQ